MAQPLPAPSWVMVGTRVCGCGDCDLHIAIWEIDTFVPGTRPVRVAVCPSCDHLTPSY